MEKEIRCNQCEKKIFMENGIAKEDFFEGRKQWGYFSKRDNELHEFILCETCYEKMIQNLKIPVKITHATEI